MRLRPKELGGGADAGKPLSGWLHRPIPVIGGGAHRTEDDCRASCVGSPESIGSGITPRIVRGVHRLSPARVDSPTRDAPDSGLRLRSRGGPSRRTAKADSDGIRGPHGSADGGTQAPAQRRSEPSRRRALVNGSIWGRQGCFRRRIGRSDRTVECGGAAQAGGAQAQVATPGVSGPSLDVSSKYGEALGWEDTSSFEPYKESQ
jgi:hypothetical protein